MNIPILSLFFKKFPVDVEIFEKRAGGWYVNNDKGRRVRTDDGRHYYELKYEKETTKPISPKFLYNDSRGKHKLKLYSPIPGVYQPITPNFEDKDQINLTIMSEDTRRFMSMKAQDIYLKYQSKESFLQKYAAIVTMIPFCILVIVILIMMSGNFEYISNAAKEVAVAFQHVAEAMNEVTFVPPM